MSAAPPTDATPARLRPKSYTVFAAAFLAGAAAAVGVNRVLDVHLAQRRPQVESEPIFVALRPLPQGSPVTVWDVALKDWPKAMLPTSALRAGDSFEGFVLRHAIREGQPLLAVQLIRSGSQVDGTAAVETFVPALPAATATVQSQQATGDLWTPSAASPSPATPVRDLAVSEPPAASTAAIAATATPVAVEPAVEPTVEPVVEPIVTPSPERAPEQTTVAMPEERGDREPQLAAVVPAELGPTTATTEPGSTTESAPTAVEPPVAPSPAVTVAATPTQPTPAGESTDDISEAVATDVASMPSVIKQPAVAGTPSSSPPTGDAGKYLVVPERIALQADTSFTTPRPQPPGPPAVARPSAGQKPRTPPRPAAQADTRRGTAPAATQPRQQPAAPPRTRQQPQTAREPQSSAARRPWSQFPAIAAGIEALSSPWQRPATTPNAQQPNTQPNAQQGRDSARR